MWVAQWKNAARELARVRASELQALSEVDSARMFSDLDRDLPPCDRATSGLVTQQAIFQKWLRTSPDEPRP